MNLTGQICVFDKTGDEHPLNNVPYSGNGNIVLQPKKAILSERQNGEYCLDLEVGREYEEFIEQDRIVKVNTPFESYYARSKYQLFRIRNIEHRPDRIIVKCPHVFYDLDGQSFYDTSFSTGIVDTWYDALCMIVDNGQGTYTTNDVIDYTREVQSQPIADFTPINITDLEKVQAIDAINTLLNKASGYLIRDNFRFGIRSEIPILHPLNFIYDGRVIEYGKNLTDITKKENWDNLTLKLEAIGATATYPYTNGSSPFWNYSDNNLYARVVKFSQSINASDYSSQADYETAAFNDLHEQAQAYLKAHKEPSISYTVKGNFSDFTDGFDNNIYMWTPVRVKDSRLGINIDTRVIGYKYDCLTNKYTEVELSNALKTMSGYNLNVSNRIKTAQKDTILDAYPVGTVYQGGGSNPSSSLGGYWEEISSSGSVHSWKRKA